MEKQEIFDLEELKEINKDKRKIFEFLYSKQDLAKYVQINKKKYKDKKTGEWKSFELKYLSWAYAYREMIRLDPEATYNEHTWPMMMKDGTIQEAYQVPYMRTETGYFVRVSVTMFGRTTSEWLAVMDSKNNAIDNPTATDINKALKRCYVKALALHGLGLFLYVGEDLPEDIQAPEMASDDQIKELSSIFEKLGAIFNDDPARLAAVSMKRLNLVNNDGHVKKFDELTKKDYQNLAAFIKPQLIKSEKEAAAAKKAAEEKAEKDQKIADELAGMGYEQKEKQAPEAPKQPVPTSTYNPNQTAGGKQKTTTPPAGGQRSDGMDLVSKYRNPDPDEVTQGALFGSLGDILDRGPQA